MIFFVAWRRAAARRYQAFRSTRCNRHERNADEPSDAKRRLSHNFASECFMIRGEYCVLAAPSACRPRAARTRRTDMMRTLGAGVLLMLAASLPAQQAAAQDPLAGAII